MSTKLRALYQRRKGRDLYDLWHVLVALDPDDERIVAGLEHYMRDDVVTFPQLAQNLRAKLDDQGFASDLDALVTTPPEDYLLHAAADLVIERLGARLRNAPPMGGDPQRALARLTAQPPGSEDLTRQSADRRSRPSRRGNLRRASLPL